MLGDNLSLFGQQGRLGVQLSVHRDVLLVFASGFAFVIVACGPLGDLLARNGFGDDFLLLHWGGTFLFDFLWRVKTWLILLREGVCGTTGLGGCFTRVRAGVGAALH